MKRSLLRPFAVVFVFAFLLLFGLDGDTKAQDHVVSPADIQRDAASASSARQQCIQQLDDFFSSNQAQQALKSAHMDSREVKDAVRQLDDEDLTQLSARAQKAQREFAAGTLSDRDLLLILVLVAVIILIIVAVR